MTPAFQWICDGVQLQGVDTRRLEQWIEQVVAAHNRFLGPVSYIFCNDDRILEVNRQFLNHDYFTDIITFDYSHWRVVSGDMFISLDTVRTNAEQVGASYDRELLRVIVHGILHLCGINDKGPGEREIMERHEDEALAMLPADIAPVR
ncbi:MAG: rRNA maturation RNase YbeY [Muribaculaceae bacterium]|nr:rRNA maturation RNase YbeY [Muribaculaceae bacterium]